MNSFAEIDPEVFIVEDAKIFSRALQKAVAIVMEGGGMNFLAEERGDAIPHLAGRSHRVCEGENLIRPGVSLLNKPGNAMNEDGCFAGTGTCDHQHRPVNMVDRFALTIIGKK